MKTYKDKSVYLGGSDIATLVCVGMQNDNINHLKTTALQMNSDGDYSAWVVDDDEIKVPAHYHLVESFINWLRIYDDEGYTTNFDGKEIELYRAGEFGILIKIKK